jgi:acyl-CoA synthetase (AMP-forming)/AMP-acid ligase II
VHVLISQGRLRTHDYLGALREIGHIATLQQVVILDGAAPAPFLTAAGFLARARSGDGRTPALEPESIACILYTSGTTGQPKGVMLSQRAILATVFPTAERSGLCSHDALLSTLPLFWVAGLVIRALPTLASGCALILVEAFTTEAVIEALRRHRPTALHLRPPQVGQLLAHPDLQPALLANVRRGGGRVEWYAPVLNADDTRLITGYGMTETAGYVTALRWDDPPEVRRTQIGRPLPGVAVRITDGSGRICAAGEVGEIRVRGPGLFSGYYKQPQATGLDGDGFFLTGDLGSVDADGTFRFIGRRKDLLRVKGINVSPAEVEAVLAAHPGVEAAYVVGLPPEGLEQPLVAVIVPKGGVPPPEAGLETLARQALSHYKRPEQYLFIDRADVPLSGTSKPQRAALAELAATRLRPTPAVAAGFQPAGVNRLRRLRRPC